MRRFKSNRWWILILALSMSVTGVAFMPTAGLADKGTDGTIGNDPTTSPTPDPTIGDPDMPSGNGKSNIQSGGDELYGTTSIAGVGDAATKGVTMTRAWMKVRLALGMLRYYYLRF